MELFWGTSLASVAARVIPFLLLGFLISYQEREIGWWVINFIALSLALFLGLQLAATVVVSGLIQEQSSSPYGILGRSALYALAGYLSIVSGSLLGNAVRHRGGIASSSPQTTTPRAGWKWGPREQALLGFAGAILAAIINVLGSLLRASP